MTETFPIASEIWCAGCGHFGVANALDSALDRLAVPRHETLVLAGIGCSGTIQNYLKAYGYHALHGRVLPTAAGAKLANPKLTVIAAGGDGDGLAIGAGHLIHTFRANPSLTYILMNNGTYGLTKGQASPTSQGGFRDATSDQQMDPIMVGLGLPGTTFLARGYSGSGDQLRRLTDAAIEHARAGRGFAFLEVISPCVAYNDRYEEWPSLLVDLDDDPSYDSSDRGGVFQRMIDIAERGQVPTGILYRNSNRDAAAAEPSPASAELDPVVNREAYAEVMRSFMG